MEELVSVIITTYKRPPEIVLRAIDSVCNQTYPNIEIIVVDDSPSNYDNRELLQKEIVKSRKEIKYIQHVKNMGACVARNTGLKASEGCYVAFLDDDDEWLPCKIEKQVKKIQDDQTVLVYCGKTIVNDTNGNISNEEVVEFSGDVYERLIYSNFIGSTSFPLIKKSALMDIGGFDPLMKSAQDYDVWLRLARKYTVCCVNLPLVKYHIHNGERISTNYQARIAGQERLIQKNLDYLQLNFKAWWWRLLRLSIQYSQSLQIKKAMQVWMQACKKQPLKVITNTSYLLRIVFGYLKRKLMGIQFLK